MKSIQYTIRSIPPKLDQELRKKARNTGKSLNQVSVEAMSKGIGLTPDNHTFSDLDWFIGSKPRANDTFEESQEWLNKLPYDLDESK
jgi:hypothetical protein